MKTKIINLLLVLTSLLGYLEWGGNNHMFLFQGEFEILKKLFTEPDSVVHPFVLMPLAGQLALVTTLFQKKPSRVLTLIGVIGLSVLLFFIFIIGLISFHFKEALSALPFILLSLTVFFNRNK